MGGCLNHSPWLNLGFPWQKAIRPLPGVSELRLCLSGGREPFEVCHSWPSCCYRWRALWKSVQISPESQGRTTFWQAKPLFLTSSPHASSGHLCGSVLSTHGSSPHRRCSEARPPLLEIAKEIFTPKKVGWNWWFFKKRRKRTHHCLDPKVLIFKVELEGMWNMNLFWEEICTPQMFKEARSHPSGT